MTAKAGSLPSWLRQNAIVWKHLVNAAADDKSCPYWNQNIVNSLSELSFDFGNQNELLRMNEIDSISYESLLIASTFLVRSLRQRLRLLLADSDIAWNGQNIGAVIVVAIPEGPFLPLAVLVAHVLNEPDRLPENPCNSLYAVMLPVEPNEGSDRLRLMINDSRPTMILCVPGNEWTRLEQVISTMDPSDESISTEGLYRPTYPVLVDFEGLLREAIEEFRCPSSPTIPMKIRDTLIQSINESLSIERAIVKCQSCFSLQESQIENSEESANRISHIVFTSGSTGIPKGCISSIRSLRHYIAVKNEAHSITPLSTVLLASALSFDPCLSDILATIEARATLAIAPRNALIQNLPHVLQSVSVTHVLCTPTLWGMLHSTGMRPQDFPFLQVIALGGEPIPKRFVQTWARKGASGTISQHNSCRLFATYGVTEACVYQTFGEVWSTSTSPGQDVGRPLRGMRVKICRENDLYSNESDVLGVWEIGNAPEIGEILLCGPQLDEFSMYLNRPDLSTEKFIQVGGWIDDSESCQPVGSTCCYRTGDRGYVSTQTGNLHILGRINGEDGMVKVNGVRVELGEIESALIDDTSVDKVYNVVVDCLAITRSTGDDDSKQIHAFCVLGAECLREVGIQGNTALEKGILCTAGPILTVLRERWNQRVRAGAIPTCFLIISRLPLSPTGKCDRRQLPQLDQCIPLDSLSGLDDRLSVLLREHGTSGPIVSDHIIDCLNLQPCQLPMLTTASNFAMLGGDSLAATRVVRSLYAHHHNVLNSRFLGGEFGVLDGPFGAHHLLRAKSMGEYVDWLDSHNVCRPRLGDSDVNRDNVTVDNQSNPPSRTVAGTVLSGSDNEESDRESMLYESLLEASTMGQSRVAMALLNLGVDPNFGDHGSRLSKVSSRIERKKKFKSNPLHLACSKGDNELVKALLNKKCKFNSPDATGSFPIHLAASGRFHEEGESLAGAESHQDAKPDEDLNRMECVKLLLAAGAPLSMKDGNKQTVLHCAARAGHCRLLAFAMEQWRDAGDRKEINVYGGIHKGGRFDWTDRWFRTPVHWAVLNGQVGALRILINGGCSSDPPKPKANRQTSVAIESPTEICRRLYGVTDGIGKEINLILISSKV